MYQDNTQTQPHVCLICLKPLKHSSSYSHLLHIQPLCQSCLASFTRIDTHLTIMAHSVCVLYAYDDFFKALLYRYKGLYDYALKDAFLPFSLSVLKRKYHDYYVVPVPSSTADNIKRGFAPNLEIVKTFSTKIFCGLYKRIDYKQSAQSYETRHLIWEVLELRSGMILYNQKVLLFDDVLTSGETIKACIRLIEHYHPACLEVLVLSSGRFRS
ncbi:MAG: ComF family protein [bacterium]